MSLRTHLRVEGTDPRRRGHDRGRRSGAEIARTWRTYSELFEVAAAPRGVTLDVPALAQRCLAATSAWAPELAAEMEGVAEGAGVPLWTIAALNARTEILAVAGTPRAGECSTVVRTGPRTVGGQTWDWHEELADGWHIQSVHGDRVGFAGITEHGILAKIGLNEAGVGVLFNILGHVEDGVDDGTDDGAGGVPVHLVARRVLGGATSFSEAIGILSEAPVSASTVVTVVTAEQAACVELSPAGAAVVPPDEAGRLVHTNHFVDPALAEGEFRGRAEPETYDRFRLLSDRMRERGDIDGADDVAALLDAHPGDGAEVCCHPPVGGTLGTRWATLATVVVEPAAGRLLVHDGGPCTARPSAWTTVSLA
ncbi:C45 family peptidase [Microtetraspora sp. NBRC 16547]|uniref:C45 family autoproteolytic acyltransferase/hydolase n=1 Tax=Microtetraspora sp. NBRC 16547 TaxID=3030993 RepID=UPI0024A3A606|nr:C45 family peptidase [Microtetraspora sp. NBRC 16547]GLX02401.1 peptidase C45 [Microtetraspora sp. NBRC 16547]